MENNKKHPYINVVVIGAGIAGLCTSYYLKKKKIDHIVIERGEIANTWNNERWDNFYLVNPNWAMKIPEFGFHSDHFPSKNPDGFLNKSEVVSYIKDFGNFIGSKIYVNENVENISKDENNYIITTSKRKISSKNIVIASGAFGNAHIPEMHKMLDRNSFQIHSSKYKNSNELPDGDVIVVGSGQSGAQIAEDLLDSGKRVWLAVSKCGRRPRRYRGKDSSWWNYKMGSFDKTVKDVPFEERWSCSSHTSGSRGGHDINLLNLYEKGLSLCGSIKDCKDNFVYMNNDLYKNIKFSDEYALNWAKNVDKYIKNKKLVAPKEEILADPRIKKTSLQSITKLDISKNKTSIIWATGFRYNFDWIDLDITDENNHPIQNRGITKYAGLYFMGLQWMYSSKSAQFIGVSEDAKYIVEEIEKKL
tara:strand:- start:3036 stop:4289 length:1254 start_codon:yes stop_codon:yes gene_type:complete